MTAFEPARHIKYTAVIAANDLEIYNSGHPKTGIGHLLDLTDSLQVFTNKKHGLVSIEEQPNLSDLLNFVGYAAMRSVVVVVSDFRGAYVYPDDPQDNWQAELNKIANKGNALIAIEVTSPEDSVVPEYVHNIRYSPRGMVWAGKNGKRFREAYSRIAKQQSEKIENALGGAGVTHVRLTTDNPQWNSNLNEQLIDADKYIRL